MLVYMYDVFLIGFENQYLIDEGNMINGLFDCFNWKLVGKKEMIVLYNVFGMYRFKSKLYDVVMLDGVVVVNCCYEMYCVWVVEVVLKLSVWYVVLKKVFYFDEDSWFVLVGEDYDVQGKLWKVWESYLILVWEFGGICDNELFVQYDMNNGCYVFDVMLIGQGKDVCWFGQVDDLCFKQDFYMVELLCLVSEW